MRVFLSAGEASGDAYAGALARRLKLAGAAIEGIGGRRLAEAANGSIIDSSRWGAISIIQSLTVAPRVIRGFYRAKAGLRMGAPGLLIAIDFGFFNIRLARLAKRLGWKVLYFIPPGSWRRPAKPGELAALADEIVLPFPWSPEAYGDHAHFFGHPLKSLIRERLSSPDRQESARASIAVLPGSRGHEIDRNLPLIARVLRGFEGTVVEFAVAPSVDVDYMRAAWRRLAPNRQDKFVQDDVYGVLSRAKAAVVCSGTATLEAALLRCPLVVVYQVSRAMVFESKLVGFKVPEFISLPNIVLQRRLVPEHLAVEVDAKAVASDLRAILDPSETRRTQLQGFVELDDLLGPDTAIEETVKLAEGMILSDRG